MMMTNEVAISVVAILFLITLYAGIIALTVINYIFTAKAMYKLSVRRNIANPWMAWVPGLNLWNLGCVTNEYDARLGMKRQWNLILVILSGATMAVGSLYSVFYSIFALGTGFGYNVDYMPGYVIFALVMVMVIMVLLLIVASVASTVQFICIFKIFESTVPDKAVKYLILSLIVPLASAFCLMKCADKGYPFPENEPAIITE